METDLHQNLHPLKVLLALLLLTCVIAVPGYLLYRKLTQPIHDTAKSGEAVLGVIRWNTSANHNDDRYLESDPVVKPPDVKDDDIPPAKSATPVNFIRERITNDERQVVVLGNCTAEQEDIDELTSILRSYPGNISVKAVSVDGTKGVSFNSVKGYDSSSTIKGPYAYYCYLQLEEGNGSLEEYMTYTGAYYAEGTGSIRYQAPGTSYTIRELLYRTMWESDNIGYAMCVSHFGKDGYNALMESLGCESLMLGYSIWPPRVRVDDLVIVWSEIYHYMEQETELSQVLYDSCTPGAWNCLSGYIPNDCTISQKYCWASTYGDGAIIRSPQGNYILSVFVNYQGSDYDRHTVGRVASAVHKIMTARRLVDKGR